MRPTTVLVHGGTTNVTRVTVAGVLLIRVPVGGQVSALLFSMIVATLLSALAAREPRLRGREPLLVEDRRRRYPRTVHVLPPENLDTP
jgi:hypothetical protein